MLTFVSYESEASRFPTGDALDPSGPDASEKEAFPRLSPDQVERLIAFGVVQQLPRGNAQHVMYVHGRHQFTGELNIFNERAVLVGGRMGVDGRVARLNFPQFRRLLAAEPDVAKCGDARIHPSPRTHYPAR
jgi:thioredoxin reductase (NADPH)